MLAFGIGATIYTAIALANMEDGGGELMLGLRTAQLARNGETFNAADLRITSTSTPDSGAWGPAGVVHAS